MHVLPLYSHCVEVYSLVWVLNASQSCVLLSFSMFYNMCACTCILYIRIVSTAESMTTLVYACVISRGASKMRRNAGSGYDYI